MISYLTFQELVTAGLQTQDNFKVTNDPSSNLNGYYHWVSGSTYEKDADTVESVIDPNNTSDGVSGAAVSEHVQDVNKNLLIKNFKQNEEFYEIELVVYYDSFAGYLSSNGSLVANAGWRSEFINVTKNDVYKLIGGSANSGGLVWIIWDNDVDKNIIARSLTGSSYPSGDLYMTTEFTGVLVTTHARRAHKLSDYTLLQQSTIKDLYELTYRNGLTIYGENTEVTAGTYAGYIKTNGGLSSNAGWTTRFYDVSVGELYRVAGGAGTSSLPWVAWDNSTDQNIILTCDFTTSGAFEDYIIIPTGCTSIAVTHNGFLYSLDTTLPLITTQEISNIKVVDFKQNVELYGIEAVVSSLIYDGFLNGGGNAIVSHGGWKSYEYDVVEDQVYYLSGTKAPSSAYASYAFWDNNTDKNVIFSTKVWVDDVYVVVPKGATKLVGTHSIRANKAKTTSRLDALTAQIGNSGIVYCDGDSLTAGAGGGGTTYPSVLQTLLGADYTVLNRGVGGENTTTIGARNGGMPMYVDEAITIPANKDQVTLSVDALKSSYNDAVVDPLLQGGGYTNPMFIQDKACTLTWNGTQYRIELIDVADRDLICPDKSHITTNAASLRGGIGVFFIGQNGGYSDANDLREQVQKLADFKGDSKFLVISSHGNGYPSTTAPLTARFGLKHVNLKEYYSTRAIYDAIDRGYLSDDGTYPTSQDLIDMAAQNAPTSLLADAIHFNSIGYTLLGELIHGRLQQLGFVA